MWTIALISAGACGGLILGLLLASNKVADLQDQIDNAKPRCDNCDYYRRMLAAEDQLQQQKDDYLRLYRSNIALRRDNKNLYQKIWRSA